MIKNVQMNVKTATGYDSLLPVTTATNVSYVNTSSELVATSVQQAIDEVVVKTVTASLTVAGWVGTEAPYTQNITIPGITASSNAIVGLSDAATAEQRSACRSAIISPMSQATGSITVVADGAKPIIDLPIIIAVLGGNV